MGHRRGAICGVAKWVIYFLLFLPPPRLVLCLLGDWVRFAVASLVGSEGSGCGSASAPSALGEASECSLASERGESMMGSSGNVGGISPGDAARIDSVRGKERDSEERCDVGLLGAAGSVGEEGVGE